MRYIVYWIRKADHTDIMTEGYVGVTNNIKRRSSYHFNYCYDNPHLKHATFKYDDLVVDIVFEGTKDDCLLKERFFRPQRLIGWNIAEGGGMPPPSKGKTWNDSRREKYMRTINENNSNYRTREQRQKGYLKRKQNGYIEGKNLRPDLICNTMWWTDGKINKRSKQSPGNEWKLGRTKFKQYGQYKTCPHCNKTGKGSGMTRFHFEKCKSISKNADK